MTSDHVLAGFVVFILLLLAAILYWIRKAQAHFDRLDQEHRDAMNEAFRRYEAMQKTIRPKDGNP